jgi:hypothetical protein
MGAVVKRFGWYLNPYYEKVVDPLTNFPILLSPVLNLNPYICGPKEFFRIPQGGMRNLGD